MTEPDLVDDSPEMGNVSQSDFRTSRILCAHDVVPRIPLALRPRRTVSYPIERGRSICLNIREATMALRLGDEAPNFTAETTEGTINFHEWLGGGWGILFPAFAVENLAKGG